MPAPPRQKIQTRVKLWSSSIQDLCQLLVHPVPPEAELPALGMGYGRRKGKEEGGEMKEIKPEVGMKRKGGKCKTKPGLGWEPSGMLWLSGLISK